MSSKSDQRYAMMDEKKRKRMISNRESARRSRMKKQQLLQNLTADVGRLQVANNETMGKIDEISKKYVICASENNVLRAQMMELTDRLRSLNDVIKNCEESLNGSSSWMAMDPILKTLQQQLPCSMQPVPTSQAYSSFEVN